MFYALQGLLINGGFSTSRHSGAISLFDREFVKTGRTGFSIPGRDPTDPEVSGQVQGDSE